MPLHRIHGKGRQIPKPPHHYSLGTIETTAQIAGSSVLGREVQQLDWLIDIFLLSPSFAGASSNRSKGVTLFGGPFTLASHH